MWQTVGQDKVVNLLKHSLSEGRQSHAYLLVGPQHVGKMTLSIDFARVLNCNANEKPCGECSSCRRIASGSHPDVQLIQILESGEEASRKAIGIEQIREMQHSVNLKPYEGGYRVIIIDGAENMSDSAANSLLKILEEPPPDTIFILLVVNEDALLSTVLSRCQKLELAPVPVHMARQILIDRLGVIPEKAELLARLCHGCIGWAISAANDGIILEERLLNLKSLVSLIEADISERFNAASDLSTLFSKSRNLVKARLELWLVWWRDLLLMKSSCAEYIVNIDCQEEISWYAERFSSNAISRFIKSIQETIQRLDKNANSRLALEVLMLDIPVFKLEESYA